MAGQKSISASNPLADDDPQNTLDRCCAVLHWMTSTTDEGSGGDVEYGRSLVLDTIRVALADASARLATKPTLEVVRG